MFINIEYPLTGTAGKFIKNGHNCNVFFKPYDSFNDLVLRCGSVIFAPLHCLLESGLAALAAVVSLCETAVKLIQLDFFAAAKILINFVEFIVWACYFLVMAALAPILNLVDVIGSVTFHNKTMRSNNQKEPFDLEDNIVVQQQFFDENSPFSQRFEKLENLLSQDNDTFSALEEPLKEFQDDYTCSISQDIIDVPVTLCTGYTYNKEHIEQWLEEHNTCPNSNIRLESKIYNVNVMIKSKMNKELTKIEAKASVLGSLLKGNRENFMQALRN